jgi:2-C-methyl-D-erythritol 4-phosphate cytidylyltransferase
LAELYVSAVIAAAGWSSRMGADMNKNFIALGGMPLLCHSALAFDKAADVKEIIVVTKDEEIDAARSHLNAAGIKKQLKFAAGGATRQESVSHALMHLDERCTHVAIHDGARPFVNIETIKDCIAKAVAYGASTAAVAAVDTCADVRDGVIRQVLDRKAVYHIQTPQVFERKLILAAHEKAQRENYTATDDSALVKRMGRDVYIAMGAYDNIKITTPEDIIFAYGIVDKRKQGKN